MKIEINKGDKLTFAQWSKKNWLLLIVIALCIAVVLYTPTMIASAVNECNNHWIAQVGFDISAPGLNLSAPLNLS